MAVGGGPDIEEMNGIASDPDSDYVYFVRTTGEVNNIANRLLDRLCQ